MSKEPSPPGSVNHGVQATTIHAEVFAVGTGATAIKNVGTLDPERLAALKDAIANLEKGISQLGLKAPAADLAQQETREMAEMAASGDAKPEGFQHALKRLKDKLQMVGVVISDVVALAGPVKIIAQALGLSLALFGLQ